LLKQNNHKIRFKGFSNKPSTFSPSRQISAPSGGLCGLGSLYLALKSTLLTQSQLMLFTYSSMRERIGEEMSVNDTSLALLNDIQLLNSYYTCKYVSINKNDAVE
jgi:hypothetical protein